MNKLSLHQPMQRRGFLKVAALLTGAISTVLALPSRAAATQPLMKQDMARCLLPLHPANVQKWLADNMRPGESLLVLQDRYPAELQVADPDTAVAHFVYGRNVTSVFPPGDDQVYWVTGSLFASLLYKLRDGSLFAVELGHEDRPSRSKFGHAWSLADGSLRIAGSAADRFLDSTQLDIVRFDKMDTRNRPPVAQSRDVFGYARATTK